MENFRGTPENRENHKSLAQRIFPRLRYNFRTTENFHYLHIYLT